MICRNRSKLRRSLRIRHDGDRYLRFDDVILVALEKLVSAQRLVGVVDDGGGQPQHAALDRVEERPVAGLDHPPPGPRARLARGGDLFFGDVGGGGSSVDDGRCPRRPG